jgi:uncharacterized protein YabE (DUF348 family)
MNKIQQTFNDFLHAHAFGFGLFSVLFAFVFFAFGLVAVNGQSLEPNDSHIVTLYVDGEESAAPTRAKTVGEFLSKAQIEVKQSDLVEPALETPIDADNFQVHVYRAKPVTIIDGPKVERVLSPHTSPMLIAEKAGFEVYPEDKLTMSSGENFVDEAIFGDKLTIERATPVTFSVYGSPLALVRTHAATVQEFLDERGIVPEPDATVKPGLDAQITENLNIFVSKFGKDVETKIESIDFETESTPDPKMPNGIVKITKPGVVGKKQVVYELVLRDGKVIERKKIQEIVISTPKKQLQKIGTKPGNGLSRSKGVNIFTDSKGVAHRETYYDLPMNVVMQNCGAGGLYTVRGDGAKVDKDGYVLVAANLNNYPRCSVVETSLGLGKVYDTGGFAIVHPYGFDLATDWSNNNGR